jgi:hypothetical protein
VATGDSCCEKSGRKPVSAAALVQEDKMDPKDTRWEKIRLGLLLVGIGAVIYLVSTLVPWCSGTAVP